MDLDAVKRIFDEALAVPAEERELFVARACGDDKALLAAVRGVLVQYDGRDHADSFGIEHKIGGSRAGSGTADPTVRLGPANGTKNDHPDRIGDYQIVRVIGRGGMGVVYEAIQDRPRRTVALKLVNSWFASDAMLKRLQFEAETLARLQHPGIAQIYEAGTVEVAGRPQPYFAMEYIVGQPLNIHVHDRALNLADRLRLIAKVCEAVQHAHNKGVIHRDLKPGNILVDAFGQPKVLDFGVARATDSDIQSTTLQSSTGQIIGTLAYMSPEQAAGQPSEIDTRSDVYSLGVIAFELLAGRLPYTVDHRMIHEAVRIIINEPPTRLSSSDRALRGDLDVIVAKAIAKDKSHRYPSAAALAEDIQRYLKNEPIVARPPSVWYRTRKFAQRNRALVTATAGIMLSLVIGAAAAVRYAIRADLESARSAQVAREATALSNLVLGVMSPPPGAPRSALQQLSSPLLEQFDQQATTKLQAHPAAEARIRAALASQWGMLGYNQQAAACALRGIECYRRAGLQDQALWADLVLNAFGGLLKAGDARAVGFAEAEMPLLAADDTLDARTRAELHRAWAEAIVRKDPPRALEILAKGQAICAAVQDSQQRANLVSGIMGRRAQWLRSLGQLAEAEQQFREAIALCERETPGNDGWLAALQRNFSTLLTETGRNVEAINLLRESVRLQSISQPKNIETLATRHNLASKLSMQDNLESASEAEAIWNTVLQDFRDTEQTNTREYHIACSGFGNFLVRRNRATEARPLLESALEGLRTLDGVDKWIRRTEEDLKSIAEGQP